MIRVAMLSLHTSPLARLGIGDGGGMNVYVRELAERLTPVGVRVDVYTQGDAEQPDVIDLRSGLRVHYVNGGSSSDPRERTARLADAVSTRIARSGGADVLHAHYWSSGVVGHELKHRLNLPLVSTFHTLSKIKTEAGIAETDLLRAGNEQNVIGCSDAIISNSTSEAADLLRLYDLDDEKVHVISPGVDHRQFTPKGRSFARQMVGLPTNRPIVLFAGRLQPIKGADVALDTIAKVRESRPDVLLVVIGGPSGPHGEGTLARMHEIIDAHGLHDNVRLVGPQPRASMAQWYQAADVCIMPSRSESFGLVALEASACGTPVVVSDVGALPNVVSNDDSGYVVPAENPSAMAKAVVRILNDRVTAAALGSGGVQRAHKFNWDTTVSRTYCLYGRAMDAVLLAEPQPVCLSA